MGENSGIQWTTHTFNPWVGCQRVSPGCVNCYAETYDKRVGGGVDPSDGKKKLRWGAQAPRVRTAPANWLKPLKWDRAAAAAGERHRVFCSSLADVFEDREGLAPWRLDLLELIRTTPHLDWLLLTKRPASILALLRAAQQSFTTSTPLHTWLTSWLDYNKPPANVWVGTTVEDQQRAEERIPALLGVPAVVRFLSCEPLLERVELRHLITDTGRADISLPPLESGVGVDWIIIGGESGQRARQFDVSWARDLVDQSREIDAAPFVKQFGSQPTDGTVLVTGGVRRPLHVKLDDHHGGDMAEWPTDLRVREFPKVRR